MSYSSTGFRKPLRNRSQLVSSGKFERKLKTKRLKANPPWNDTVNDLTVHKLTSEELQKNHDLHRPKKDHERIYRKNLLDSPGTQTEFDPDNNSSGFFTTTSRFGRQNTSEEPQKKQLRFYSQDKEFNDLLSETDKTIGEVQDIFGDDIFKYKSVPIFTKAPHFSSRDGNHHAASLMIPSGDNVSYYDTLSESIVRELNPGSLSEDEVENTHDNASTNSVHKNKVDLDHYHKVLSKSSLENYGGLNKIDIPDIQSLAEELTQSICIDKEDDCDGTVTKNTDDVNSTFKDKSGSGIPSTSLDSFDDMKKLLGTLEGEIIDYEKETGKENLHGKIVIPSSIRGYTAHLISVIIRLTRHLRDSEIQLKTEMAMRSEIVDMFDDQRQLVEVLTNNLMELEKSNAYLQKELGRQKIAYERDCADMKRELENLESRLITSIEEKRKPSLRKPLEDTTNITNTRGISWDENLN